MRRKKVEVLKVCTGGDKGFLREKGTRGRKLCS